MSAGGSSCITPWCASAFNTGKVQLLQCCIYSFCLASRPHTTQYPYDRSQSALPSTIPRTKAQELLAAAAKSTSPARAALHTAPSSTPEFFSAAWYIQQRNTALHSAVNTKENHLFSCRNGPEPPQSLLRLNLACTQIPPPPLKLSSKPRHTNKGPAATPNGLLVHPIWYKYSVHCSPPVPSCL